MTGRRRFLGSLAAWLPAVAREKAPAEPRQTEMFQAGDEGYHTYRIPALLVTGRGTLLAFAEGRKDSAADHGDIDIVVKRSSDGGGTWSRQSVVYEEGGTEKVTIGNPCPVLERQTGTVWLPFTRDNHDVLVTASRDDGRTWSRPVMITREVKRPGWSWYATGPGVGIQLRRGRFRGRLVVPCDHREEIDGRPVKMSHVFWSDDRGRSWRLGGSVARHTDECQVVELNSGSLLINMRNYWEREGNQPEKGRKRAIARSGDGGDTWSDLSFDDQLIEPVCQASLISHPSAPGGRRAAALLFSNPASRDSRTRMTVRLSWDEGQTWPAGKLIHEGPSAYSCLAALKDGTVGLLYERGEKRAYERITFARFSLPWLASRVA